MTLDRTRWDIVGLALGAGYIVGLQVGQVPPALPNGSLARCNGVMQKNRYAEDQVVRALGEVEAAYHRPRERTARAGRLERNGLRKSPSGAIAILDRVLSKFPARHTGKVQWVTRRAPTAEF